MRTRHTQGFSMVELLIYIGILTLFSLLVVNTILVLSTSYRKLALARTITSSASTALERITREIRNATSVDISQSILNISPGRLRLQTTNDSGFVQVISFALENGQVNVYENDLLAGPLTSVHASTTNLVFRLHSGTSKAVSVEMTIQATGTAGVRSERFQTTVVLRNSL